EGVFGEKDPRKMPPHFFGKAHHVDYKSAVKADVSKQNFLVAPRFWYVDATYTCKRCKERFVFTAREQRFWYEDMRFYLDSYPKQCGECRRELRELASLRQEYDREISGALARDGTRAQKERMVAVVDALEEGGV